MRFGSDKFSASFYGDGLYGKAKTNVDFENLSNFGFSIGYGLVTKIRIIFLNDVNFFQKMVFLIIRTLYAFFTFYLFRMFMFTTMNNLGQLNFDKKFNMTVFNVINNLNTELPIKNFRVSLNPLSFMKKFILIAILGVLFINSIYYIKSII